MRSKFTNLPPLLVCLGALTLSASAAGPRPVDFNRDVRPILSSICLKCHGIDDQSRKAKLRLDVRESAIAPLKGGDRAIVPGKPDESELVTRIFSDDDDELMPPPKTGVKLTDAQKNVLKQWIAEGAKYEKHWAFVPPKQAALPSVKRSDWCRNPIDRFVLANLESQGLAPSPDADRYELVRRVYLDLIGLPPTPQEADAFAHDPSPDAYEKLVDRLLANPHYGERWARRWLDLARYADTNGFEKDRPRSMWPYRDWVIHAYNTDMPFDQFTVEQLAGDMLPNATPEQRIATGFHRNTMLNEEGGIDPLEYRYMAMVDRNATTGTTWLGLTVGCAQCHTHKFDPLTHKEYYQLMAFLDNADEPRMDVPETDAAVGAQRTEIEAKIDKLTASLPDQFPGAKPALDKAFAAWEQQQSDKAVQWTTLRPDQMQSSKPFLTLLADGSVLAGGDVAKSVTYDLTFHAAPPNITAVRLEVLPDDSLPGHGPGMVFYEGEPGDFFLSEIALQADGQLTKFSTATQDFGTPASMAIDGDPQSGWSIKGGEGKPHVAIFRLAAPTANARELQLHMLFERYFASPLGHFRISVSTDPRAAQAVAFPPEVNDALVAGEQRSAAQADLLMHYFLSVAPELAEARKKIDALRAKLPKPVTTLVLRERPVGHPRSTFIHHRGEYLQPEEQVVPGVPAFLPSLSAGATANRLTFAHWLVSLENPLTARVQVNRQWAAFFGRGIVLTLQDFGYQGEMPSNPELLDWMAVEFMNQGWSLKKLDRLIVTSATYRQSSRVSPELLARDPDNVLLARGPRFRLEAEQVRDAALAASGLLSDKIGGPSVFPPQPASITTEGAYGALKWETSKGEDRFRRSLYTFSKRTAPFALYNTFDGPTGEVCLARREVSDSPLQALALLNDTVFVEAAQAMGRAVGESKQSDEAKATDIFRRCLTRPPDSDELHMLVIFAREQRERFAGKELDAAKIAGGSEGDVIERATWTATARAVLNLDEAVTKE